MDKLYLVIPCYKEEEVLPETAKRLQIKMQNLINSQKISADSKVVFVNDGSIDRTWEIIQQLYKENSLFEGVNLSRNFGHQNALLAGLMTAKEYADVVITLDADLQDDINAIDEMLEKYYSGSDIVYGVRSERKKDSWFKRSTSIGFYKLMQLLGTEVVFNHCEYRLMSKRVLDALENYNEVNLFLRGLIPMIGYPSDIVYYERHERYAGESKYPLKSLIFLAFEGITSLSVKPIRLIMGIGLLMFILSFGMLGYFLVQYLLGNTVAGWATLAVSIWGLGGLQLLAIGVVGEYVGKVYLETKHRPRYIVEQYLHDESV